MKLLINASTLSATGVTQVAVSFINECIKFSKNIYVVAISDTIASQLNLSLFPSNFSFFKVNVHPLFTIKSFQALRVLKNLELENNVDCVFSVFGPSYWTPKGPHLQGYAYPCYVYPDSPFFNIISIKERLKNFIYKNTHRLILTRNGKYFVSETSDVSSRASKFLKCSPENMYTVSNTFSHFFNDFIPESVNYLPALKENEFRFLSLCSFAPHKNLEILNKVIPILKERLKEKKITFVLTVDEELYKKKINEDVRKSIINIGRVDVAKCPQLYQECNALFLPTLLECFSANYPESMKMRRPILTSNLSFATGVCENASIYFDPLDPNDISEKIIELATHPNLVNKLVLEGVQQIKKFLSSEERAEKYLEICNTIMTKR